MAEQQMHLARQAMPFSLGHLAMYQLQLVLHVFRDSGAYLQVQPTTMGRILPGGNILVDGIIMVTGKILASMAAVVCGTWLEVIQGP